MAGIALQRRDLRRCAAAGIRRGGGGVDHEARNVSPYSAVAGAVRHRRFFGFFYASKVWQNGALSGANLGRAALGWVVGISLYIAALRPMAALAVTSAEMQTTVWFAMTIIGVVVISGRFFTWPRLEQGVALLVMAALGWLLLRTSQP